MIFYNKNPCFVSVLMQKRLRKERRARRRLQEQLELEMKKRAQLEEALKASGATEALRILNGESHKVTTVTGI